MFNVLFEAHYSFVRLNPKVMGVGYCPCERDLVPVKIK